MSGRIFEPQTLRPRLEAPTALQGRLRDPVAAAGTNIEMVQAHGELSPDLIPRPAKKRQLDLVSEIDPLLSKKARVKQTSIQSIGSEQVKQMATSQRLPDKIVSTSSQLKPTVFNPQYSGITKSFLHPAKPSLCPDPVHAYISKWLESISIDPDQDEWCRPDSHSEDESAVEELAVPTTGIGSTPNVTRVATSQKPRLPSL
ncbi:hypothetical protein EDB81DRAFT_7129 [Dactylonectria macrodidyma]|uniref:Uncharacterized protein n=1 Tax=Dactylonectria macrodidyma TaxID=307937 RepID=A0A9P9FSL0_9HYPO|nr:hypothetical protein EDB81DRAFT_7129 [Dactylonectria macrodidyma]